MTIGDLIKTVDDEDSVTDYLDSSSSEEEEESQDEEESGFSSPGTSSLTFHQPPAKKKKIAEAVTRLHEILQESSRFPKSRSCRSQEHVEIQLFTNGLASQLLKLEPLKRLLAMKKINDTLHNINKRTVGNGSEEVKISGNSIPTLSGASLTTTSAQNSQSPVVSNSAESAAND